MAPEGADAADLIIFNITSSGIILSEKSRTVRLFNILFRNKDEFSISFSAVILSNSYLIKLSMAVIRFIHLINKKQYNEISRNNHKNK